MTETAFASVWDTLEDTPQQAENMKLRAALMMALKAHIARAGLTQTQAARLFGVTQPRVSDLLRGKINRFSLDTLVSMAAVAGLQVAQRMGTTHTSLDPHLRTLRQGDWNTPQNQF